jgi:hypothetical protein
MKSSKSEHFVINYLPNSTAASQSVKILDLLEKSYIKIIQELDLKISPVIKVYLYQTKKDKIRTTGEGANAHTNREKFEFFAIYNSKIKAIGCHELVHLLTNHLGVPNYVFNEGLAEYFEDDWGAVWNGKLQFLPHDEWVRRFVYGKSYVPINQLFEDYKFLVLDPTGKYSYPESGSFIKYLVKKYGIEKVMLAYGQLKRKPEIDKNKHIFRSVFGLDIEQAEKDYRGYIQA